MVIEPSLAEVVTFGGRRMPHLARRPNAREGATSSPSVLSPSDFGALLRTWQTAADYNAATGSWPAKAGAVAPTLTQATAGKRPSKANNALFSNKPTLNFDGVDDELGASGVFVINVVGAARTTGFLGRWPGGAASYLVGQYATGYNFYRWDGPTDQMYADPNFGGGGFLGAGIAGVHLWLWSEAAGSCTLLKDGAPLFTRTHNTPTGAAGAFAIGSAGGGGFSAAECGEFFTLDKAVSTSEAQALTRHFKNVEGYPL